MHDHANSQPSSSSKAPEPFGQPEKRKKAEQAAMALIDSFVDRRVATGFVDKLIAVLEGFPAETIERLVDPQRGLPRHFSRMPSLKDIADFAGKLTVEGHEQLRRNTEPEPDNRELRSEGERKAFAEKVRRSPEPPLTREPFRPFPKLWEAFADDPEALRRLDSCLAFPMVEAASRALARDGPTAARIALGIDP
jgi:hypothetical protein